MEKFMSNESKQEYLGTIKQRYYQSSKKEKKKILDEFCLTCSYNRKYAIRIINQKETKKSISKQRAGRKKIYIYQMNY